MRVVKKEKFFELGDGADLLEPRIEYGDDGRPCRVAWKMEVGLQKGPVGEGVYSAYVDAERLWRIAELVRQERRKADHELGETSDICVDHGAFRISGVVHECPECAKARAEKKKEVGQCNS